jgi:hypothetical protein
MDPHVQVEHLFKRTIRLSRLARAVRWALQAKADFEGNSCPFNGLMCKEPGISLLQSQRRAYRPLTVNTQAPPTSSRKMPIPFTAIAYRLPHPSKPPSSVCWKSSR